MSCGNPIAPGARFCAFCGQSVRVTSEERRVVTILFADLVGFTGLSESLDPEQVKHLIDAAFQRLVHDVVTFGGRVDKIVGDAIVALFGAPIAHEDDAERAVRAALRMQSTLAHFAEEHGESIRMRIGVNTGEVLVGSLRAGGDYTAMGDVVNTAARLQTAADPGAILVGELTFRATDEAIRYNTKGALYLRGRATPVNVWEPVEVLTLPGARPKSFRLPMIGRDGELVLLRGSVENSILRARAQMILLLGDAGVGKSRLASELADLLKSDHQARVYAGRCVPYGEANLWWPLAEVLREGCGVVDGDSPATVSEKVTTLCDKMIDPTIDGASADSVAVGLLHIMGFDSRLRSLDPARSRVEATDALVAFLKAAARIGPIVVRVIDLHWADDSILALIDELSERLSRMPVVVIGTARRSLMRRWSPRIGRFNALVMNLEPLDDRQARDLLVEMTIGAEFDDVLIERVLERAGGNPLFLEELVRFLMKHRGTDIDTVEIPDGLRGLVAARIDALTAEEQAVVEDASVWGTSGSMQVLMRLGLARSAQVDVQATVSALSDKEILLLDHHEQNVDWSFRSDVVREVAYGRLTKTDRLARHRGIAEYLATNFEDRYAEDAVVDVLARHFSEAAELARSMGDDAALAETEPKAVYWIQEAAARAESSASWPHAIRLYGRLIDMAANHEGDPDADRAAFGYYLGRAKALVEKWDLDSAQADLITAGRLASAADSVAAAWIKVVRSELERRRGNADRARRYAESALEQFIDGGDLRGQAEARHLVGVLALFRGEWATAEDAVTGALSLYVDLEDRRGQGWAHQHLAWISFARGRIAEADERIADAIDAFEEFGDRAGGIWARGLRARVLILRGERPEAERLARSLLSQIESGNDPWGEAMMLAALGTITLWDGKTTAALDYLERSSDLFVRLGEPFGVALSLAILGRATVMGGRVEDGMALIDRSGKAATSGSRYHVVARVTMSVYLGKAMTSRARRTALTQSEMGAEAAGHEMACALALAAVQSGHIAEAGAYLAEIGSATHLESSVRAVRAWILVTADEPESPLNELEHVLNDTTATYMDHLLAQLAVVVWHGRRRELALATAAARDATQTVTQTEDALAKAIAGLFLYEAAHAEGAEGAEVLRELNNKKWSDLGVRPKAWQAVTQRYLAHPSR